MKKGNISIAIEETIDLWIEEQERKQHIGESMEFCVIGGHTIIYCLLQYRY
jgi:hypothetical protein